MGVCELRDMLDNKTLYILREVGNVQTILRQQLEIFYILNCLEFLQ